MTEREIKNDQIIKMFGGKKKLGLYVFLMPYIYYTYI